MPKVGKKPGLKSRTILKSLFYLRILVTYPIFVLNSRISSQKMQNDFL